MRFHWSRKLARNILQARMIEVEKHFAIGAETRTKLTALGAKQNSKEEFTDVYFDTTDRRLMTSAHWLRKRDGRWQLKYSLRGDTPNVGTLDRGQLSRTECNYELEEDPAIVRQLRTGGMVDDESESLNHLVEGRVLLPVAEFSTVREGWVWPDKRMGECVSIELDEASFGYAVGSVEVMVSTTDEVPSAQAVARDIAGKIGMLMIILVHL